MVYVQDSKWHLTFGDMSLTRDGMDDHRRSLINFPPSE